MDSVYGIVPPSMPTFPSLPGTGEEGDRLLKVPVVEWLLVASIVGLSDTFVAGISVFNGFPSMPALSFEGSDSSSCWF